MRGLVRVNCQGVSAESFSPTIMAVAHLGQRKTAGLAMEPTVGDSWGWESFCNRR
jgi:hypothetical protein